MRFSFHSCLNIFCVVLLVSLSACTTSPTPEPPQTGTASVQDHIDFPQDLTAYITQSAPIISMAESKEQDAAYNANFFSTWYVDGPTKGHKSFFQAELDRTGKNRGYAENLKPWTENNWQSLVYNANWKAMPTMMAPAITVRPTDLRLAPTKKPRFPDIDRPGQGYPFDEFEQSALPIGHPLMVFHKSRDGEWLYVESSLVSGWISANDIAFVNTAFMETWQRGAFAALIKDNTPLLNGVTHGNIGTILPLVRKDGSSVTVRVPVRASNGIAHIETSVVPTSNAVQKPLPLTQENLAAIGNQMINEPYGWGGLLEDRDCSLTMRDLYTPFGIWLHRNSRAQAKVGQAIPMPELSDEMKDRYILQNGVPFASLLFLPGHIGLYVGQKNGKAAMFHNMWGVRTIEADGQRNGRHVIGRCSITSTSPGKELRNVAPEGLLIKRINTLTNITQ